MEISNIEISVPGILWILVALLSRRWWHVVIMVGAVGIVTTALLQFLDILERDYVLFFTFSMMLTMAGSFIGLIVYYVKKIVIEEVRLRRSQKPD